jgi:N-acetylglucosamine-6-sulfatase
MGGAIAAAQGMGGLQRLRRRPGARPRNIIFILSDDHRYDSLGFLKGQSFLQTPVLDSLGATESISKMRS